MRRTPLLSIYDNEVNTGARQLACVADLPTGLGIKWRPVENDLAFIARIQLRHCRAALQQSNHLALGFQTLVALEECP